MRGKNISVAAISTILLLGLIVYLAPSIPPSIPQVKASSRTISLVGTTGAYYYWNDTNPTITVTQGDTLTIDVSNSNPGTYMYYCTIHPGSMLGSFVIQSQSPSTPDFTVNPSATSLTVDQGSPATAKITMASVNGFSGSVSLTAAVSPSGPQASFSPASISLSAGGSASSTLTVSTSSTGYYSTPVALGSYAVNVTASSGSLSHSTTVTLTVSSTTTPPSGNSNLPVLPIIGGIIGAIVVVGVVVYLIRRKP